VKCDTNTVTNNDNNFLLPCVWLWQDGWLCESPTYFPDHCRTTSYKRCTWQRNSDHVFHSIYMRILVNPVNKDKQTLHSATTYNTKLHM
jgi:hypothetical protein